MFVSLEIMAQPFPKTDYTGARFGRGKKCFQHVKFKISFRKKSRDGQKTIRFASLYPLRV